jgi:hypothetical protein
MPLRMKALSVLRKFSHNYLARKNKTHMVYAGLSLDTGSRLHDPCKICSENIYFYIPEKISFSVTCETLTEAEAKELSHRLLIHVLIS